MPSKLFHDLNELEADINRATIAVKAAQFNARNNPDYLPQRMEILNRAINALNKKWVDIWRENGPEEGKENYE